jgi:hypothetical protein
MLKKNFLSSSICNHAEGRTLGTKTYQFINISEFMDHKKTLLEVKLLVASFHINVISEI